MPGLSHCATHFTAGCCSMSDLSYSLFPYSYNVDCCSIPHSLINCATHITVGFYGIPQSLTYCATHITVGFCGISQSLTYCATHITVGLCGIPQSPRRMDSKALSLGSASAMLFCVDNPCQAPTTPQSFCSSACLAPPTSSTSSTPDYAAGAANAGGQSCWGARMCGLVFVHVRVCVCVRVWVCVVALVTVCRAHLRFVRSCVGLARTVYMHRI